ncbi:Protein of unknown function [Paramicrobacterium humi]|uniref:DUF3515 domain-containing protein n=1 Tax=Paramicrobacterium humi TaxID=640635 RepID=A0A1H4TKF0_9MICO|nr:DUF3515 family protein [Microbacterium humi]SEC56544.1 Protein of unknown function [Microbacterium humi]
MSVRARRLVSVALLSLTAVSLAGCAGAVSLKPAPDANNPDCAAVTVRLPDAVDSLQKRETTAQATGAWGDPAAVLLHCGVTPIGPTTLPCFQVNGVDWVRDSSEAPLYRFTTFGRTPAVEVVIDNDKASGSALLDLSGAVSVIPQTSKCLNAEDVTGDGSTPAPTATPSENG